MTTFSDLGLPRPIVAELSRQGMAEAFPIQAAAIPDALAGRDVLGRGPTGSGKTLAFGLPLLAQLADAASGVSRPAKPRGLILAPTRELAQQIHQRLDPMAAAVGLRVLCFVGGVNINRHIRQLARPVDLLVATPGRALDLVRQGKLSLSDVRFTALDEADQMADMGFIPQVRALLRDTQPDGQRLFFSATLDDDVAALVDDFLDNPVTHSTAPAAAAVDTMRHALIRVGSRERRNDVVARIAGRAGKTIMFMRTKHGVDRQVKKLRRVGLNALPLHGDKSQGARERAITGFQDGSVPILVATDIAARGIDIHDVSLVVHVDPPAEHKAYLHRAGRTARAGSAGTVVTLVMDEQTDEVDALLRKAKVTAEVVDISDAPLDDAAFLALTGATPHPPQGAPLPPPGAQPDGGADARGRAGKSKSGNSGGRTSGGRGSGRGKPGRGKPSRAQATRGKAPRGKHGGPRHNGRKRR